MLMIARLGTGIWELSAPFICKSIAFIKSNSEDASTLCMAGDLAISSELSEDPNARVGWDFRMWKTSSGSLCVDERKDGPQHTGGRYPREMAQGRGATIIISLSSLTSAITLLRV